MTDFYRQKKRDGTYRTASWCKRCVNDANMAAHRRNPTASKAAMRRYNASPKGKAKQQALLDGQPLRRLDIECKKEHRKRAKKLGLFVENVSREEIAQRDDWRCHVCSEPVTRDNWSLDHVVPLALQGPHARWNVRLAHLVCNVLRTQ